MGNLTAFLLSSILVFCLPVPTLEIKPRNTDAPSAALRFSRAARPHQQSQHLQARGEPSCSCPGPCPHRRSTSRDSPGGRAVPRASLGRGIPRDALSSSETPDATGRATAEARRDTGNIWHPSLPHRLYLQVKAEGNDYEAQIRSLPGGGTQQVILSDRNNNLFLYI